MLVWVQDKSHDVMKPSTDEKSNKIINSEDWADYSEMVDSSDRKSRTRSSSLL